MLGGGCFRVGALTTLLVMGLASGTAAQARVEGQAPWRCEQGMEALLGRFSQMRAMEARFEETKTIALLMAPLESRGSVRFVAPGLLLREQLEPVPSRMLLDGDAVRFRDEGGERTARLSAWEAAEGLVSGYLKVLQGDASGLRRHYQADFSCQGASWKLTLSPRTAALKKLLQRMVLMGTGTRLTSSDMLDGHGDRTVTRFSEHVEDPGAVGDAASLRRRFQRALASGAP